MRTRDGIEGGDSSHEKPLEEIIDTLLETDAPLRSTMLAGLSNLTPDEARVFGMAWPDIDTQRRRQILYRLIELAEDNTEYDFDAVFRRALRDEDAQVRCRAIEGLWENDEPSLIGKMVDMLENDASEQVQAAAASALGRFSLMVETEALRPEYRNKIAGPLFRIIGDKARPVEVRRRALEAVAPFNLPGVNKEIVEAYQSGDPAMKVSAIFAMGRNCNRSWLPFLLKELSSPQPEIRYEAVTAAGELAEEEAAEAVAAMVGDPDLDVSLAAIQALGKIGGKLAKQCLTQSLESPSEVVREAAGQALNELNAWEDPLSFSA